MNRQERHALNLFQLMYDMGHHSTLVRGTYGDGGNVWALTMAFQLDEPSNDLDSLKAQLNGRLVEQGFFITFMVQSGRMIFCVVGMHEREM